MKVLIFTHGSRGDVQPFSALAHELDYRGHDLAIGAPVSSREMMPTSAHFIGFDDTPGKWMTEPGVLEAMSNSYRGLRGKGILLRTVPRVRSLASFVFDEMAEAADFLLEELNFLPDIIVHHIDLPANEIAELLSVPAVPMLFEPTWVPTSSFPNPIFPFNLPPALNRKSYFWSQLRLQIFLGKATKWRREKLSLPRRRGHRNSLRNPDGSPATVIQGFSRHLLPGKIDYPPEVHTAGFLTPFREREWTPPHELSEFLSEGAPPVYIGFGSMVGGDPRSIGRVVTEAVRIARTRAVVVTGWGGIRLDEEYDDILRLNQASFDWLFPRTSAIVHHGGSGTTGYATKSGVPQIVCPFIGGQKFFARQLHSHGVAPPPLLHHNFNAQHLAESIMMVNDTNYIDRAAELGARVRCENGPANAANVLEEVATLRR